MKNYTNFHQNFENSVGFVVDCVVVVVVVVAAVAVAGIVVKTFAMIKYDFPSKL